MTEKKNERILNKKKLNKLTFSAISCLVWRRPSNFSFSWRFFIKSFFSSIIFRRSVAIFSSTFLSISARFSATFSSFVLASKVRSVPSKLAKSRDARFLPARKQNKRITVNLQLTCSADLSFVDIFLANGRLSAWWIDNNSGFLNKVHYIRFGYFCS